MTVDTCLHFYELTL